MNKKADKIVRIQSIGPAEHYNGIIFGDMHAYQADTEGALAVAGNGKFGDQGHGYDIGGSAMPGGDTVFIGEYVNQGDYPTLLLGGLLAQDSHQAKVWYGDIMMKSSNQQAYEDGSVKFSYGNIRYEEDTVIDHFFAEVRTKVLNLGKNLLSYPVKALSMSELINLKSQNLDDYTVIDPVTALKMLILTLPDQEVTKITEINLPDDIIDFDIIVINSLTTHLEFSGGTMLYKNEIINTSAPRSSAGNGILKMMCTKVVWNLPKLETLENKGAGIIGSVIAPQAEIFGSGGSINGMLIAGELIQKGGMELHAFTLCQGDKIWNIPGIDSSKSSIRIIKADADDKNITLPNALFDLFIKKGQLWEEINIYLATDENGELTISDLETGDYKLVETFSPEGYELPDSPDNETYFSITGNETAELNAIYITNKSELKKPVTGSVKIYKIDKMTEALLPGAVFQLYQMIAGAWQQIRKDEDLITLLDGEIIIGDLAAAQYKLVETEAPLGYLLPDNNTAYFEIIVENESIIKVPEPIYIRNSKDEVPVPAKGKVTFVKKDGKDEFITLSGARFDLYKRSSSLWIKLQEDLYTDDDGRLVVADLEAGDYKLVETKAPPGYILPDDEEDNETLFTVVENQEEEIDIWNEREEDRIEIYGSAEIIKVDSLNRLITLQGAEFNMYQRDEDHWNLLFENLRTDEEGKIVLDELELGEYKLVEVKAPDGYQLNNSEEIFEVRLDDEGILIELDPIYIKNTRRNRARGKVSVIKVDESCQERVLPGAEFVLYKKISGRWHRYSSRHVTNTEGRLHIDGLFAGEYKLTEVKAPDGYEVIGNGETIFEINVDSNNQAIVLETIRIANRRIKEACRRGKIEIWKLDADNCKITLPDAVFTLYRKNGSAWQVYREELITDEQGRLLVEDIEPGEYKLQEIKAPFGYLIARQNEIEFSFEPDEQGRLNQSKVFCFCNRKKRNFRTCQNCCNSSRSCSQYNYGNNCFRS